MNFVRPYLSSVTFWPFKMTLGDLYSGFCASSFRINCASKALALCAMHMISVKSVLSRMHKLWQCAFSFPAHNYRTRPEGFIPWIDSQNLLIIFSRLLIYYPRDFTPRQKFNYNQSMHIWPTEFIWGARSRVTIISGCAASWRLSLGVVRWWTTWGGRNPRRLTGLNAILRTSFPARQHCTTQGTTNIQVNNKKITGISIKLTRNLFFNTGLNHTVGRIQQML